MKKAIAAGAAAVVLVSAAGFGVRQATSDPAPCQKPLTIFSSEQTASIAALEEYMSENFAPTVKYPEQLVWQSDDFNPTILPNKISARIVIVQGYSTTGYYHVTVTRDCQGGEWTVTEFKKMSSGG